MLGNTGRFSSSECRFSYFLAVASDNEPKSILYLSDNQSHCHGIDNDTLEVSIEMSLEFSGAFLPAENNKQKKQIRL
jgi:hypothetical protein